MKGWLIDFQRARVAVARRAAGRNAAGRNAAGRNTAGRNAAGRNAAGRRASVLILVLWISLGLASIALLFGHSMMLEYRAADNVLAQAQAEQAMEGARAYVEYVLANVATGGTTAGTTGGTTGGTMPDPTTYESEQVSLDESYFWLIGRGDDNLESATPVYGLVDESSKLNVNTASPDMLQTLPGMTPELAAAIKDWRDSDETLTQGGAESQDYEMRDPAYECKNANFETLEELRLVMGADMPVLYGEDANFNGVLDPNEDDGDQTEPADNQDGHLDPGVLEYLTVYSREPNVAANGSTRTNVNDFVTNSGKLTSFLQQKKLDKKRINNIVDTFKKKAKGQSITSLTQFYGYSGMTADEFLKIADSLTYTTNKYIAGLVNVNTASATVLACVPGIGQDNADTLVAYRQQNPDSLASLSWLAQVLTAQQRIQAYPYITAKTYQVSADITAVGHGGRGLRRVRYVFDMASGTPTVLYRRDETRLGWPLPAGTREALATASPQTTLSSSQELR